MTNVYSCPVCDARKFENILHIKNLEVFSALKDRPFSEKRTFDARLFRCKRCGFVTQQLNPKLKKFLSDFYKQEESFFTPPPAAPSARNRFDVAFLKKSRRRKVQSILEIGSYDGYFLDFMGKSLNAKELVGLEIMKKRNPYKHIRMIHDAYPTKRLAGKKFDLVIIMNVLEHIFAPRDFMTAIKENLADNGSVLIEIPNEEHSFKAGALSFQHQHISYFTPRTARLFLAGVDFKIDGLYLKDWDRMLIVCSTSKRSSTRGPREDKSALGYAAREHALRKRFKKIIGGKKTIGLYGAATSIHNMMQIVPQAKLLPVFDGDPRKSGKYMSDNQNAILSPEEIDSSGVDCILIMPLSFTEIIYASLTKLGVKTPIRRLFTQI